MYSVQDLFNKLDELHTYGYPDVQIVRATDNGVDIATQSNTEQGVIRTPNVSQAIEVLEDFKNQCFGPPTPTK